VRLTSPKVNHCAAIFDPVVIDGYDALSITKAALRLAAVSPTSACGTMYASYMRAMHIHST
jgi:hypothetical protein